MTGKTAALAIPGEWGAIERLYIGFASDETLWGEDLARAQAEIGALARFFTAQDAPGAATAVTLVAADQAAAAAARALSGGSAEILCAPFGDIWLRDTGPIFGRDADARLGALRFAFNGWGGKYSLPGDDKIGDRLAAHAGAAVARFSFVLEGGAVELDGEGALLTTRQCMLNPNRNPDWRDEAAAEAALKSAFGVESVLWLEDGLLNDHTDGHIDNLVRFIGPGRVLAPSARDAMDPNAALYADISERLALMRDARGRRLTVLYAPSPGLIVDEDDEPMPASHMNFLRANGRIAVPIYAPLPDRALRDAFTAAFPGESVAYLPANAILTGGGSFHCISQQIPPRA